MVNISNSDIQTWLKKAGDLGLITQKGFSDNLSHISGIEYLLYPSSVKKMKNAAYALLKMNGRKILGMFGSKRAGEYFEGIYKKVNSDVSGFFCPLDHRNAEMLRNALPFTAPSPLGGIKATIGLGDRLGVAGPGHIRALVPYNIAPVFAQQSLRELDLMQRSYEDVLDSSTWSVFQEGYTGPWGADGDHLKTEEWVKKALKIGFTMITADVSDHIKNEYSLMPESDLVKVYSTLDEGYRRRIEERYLPFELGINTGEVISFSRTELARISLIYKAALEHATRLYRAGAEEKPEGAFDFELSIDESETPTTSLSHVFIAMEMAEAHIKISSLAPRFIGEFQKGIDYIGDPEAFKRSFRIHAAIAEKFGHKISVHSGSDKFTIFPIIGEITGGRFHVKTAGTSWLEAMKVIARTEPRLYRRLHQEALVSFQKAAKYYLVTPNLNNVVDVSALQDEKLPVLFQNPDFRQLIHITYGEILRDPSLNEQFFHALDEHIEEYWQALQKHIGRHLELLGV